MKISYLCIVKMNEEGSARTRKNYFSRALGNSATCGSKLASDIKDQTSNIKHLNFYLQIFKLSIINSQLKNYGTKGKGTGKATEDRQV